MSGYTADDVLERLWNNSADEEDIFGNEFDSKSDEDYRDESGPHRGEKMARKNIQTVTFQKESVLVNLPFDSSYTVIKLIKVTLQ